MKIRQLVIFGVFIAISALIYWRLTANQKPKISIEKEKSTIAYVPILKVKNQEKTVQLSAYGQINPSLEFDISFEVQGKLEQGAKQLKAGMKFQKGQVLYTVNRDEAFYTLNARKTQLSNLIINALPDVELDYPSERSKWLNFMNGLKPGQLMPNLPTFNSDKERMFFTSRTIVAEYYNIKSLEARMEKYYYIAPFSGTITEVFTEPGALAGPGVRIAKITKTGDFEVKVPISIKNLAQFKSENQATFLGNSGETIGTGKIIRISDVVNQKTQSIDVYYSIRPASDATIYNGMFLDVKIKQKTSAPSFVIPRMAMQDEKVQLLVQNKITERNVQVIGSKPDSIFVTGLQDGESVLIERTEVKDESQKIIGIKR